MSYLKNAYRRRAFAGEGHTGSLVFDQHRREKMQDSAESDRKQPSKKDTFQQFHV